MRVKVCGITSVTDALLAVNAGASALGFNFYAGSPRHVRPDEAARIIRHLPPFVTPVGVFVNAGSPDEVLRVARRAGIQALQLHGDESPEYCRNLDPWPVIKAVRVGNGPPPANLEAYPVQAFLMDSRDDTLFGGTGKTFNWRAALGLDAIRPVILAGGLNAENVARAIRALRPYAVDVCSGVEREPGVKDPSKLNAFMNEVRNASGEQEAGH